ncbi:MAG TPA: hypothetical protein VHA12_03540 [Candidatus Nanoarchaeia archaeon]|nr:hypothetical protein [Candidatus Nanoarchaeia archaeon]
MKKGEYSVLVVALFCVILTIVFVSARADWTVSGTSANGTEDTLFVYNLTMNVSSVSWTEGLQFTLLNVSTTPSLGFGSNPSNYSWISLGTSTGILTLNSTTDNQSVLYSMFINVINSSGSGGTEPFTFNITPVNDAPAFQNLQNLSFNMSSLFSTAINVTDEENNYPYTLNITFLNCSVAQWSTRNCSNESGRTLFNSSQYTFNSTTGRINISFTPDRNDVGSYIISFNVTDSGNYSLPFNASYVKIVNYTVLQINSKPYFRYVCDNERNATEDSLFSCIISASDIDETNNLTIRALANGTFSSSNKTWFVFNSTPVSHISSVKVNISTQFNASWLANFTLNDYNVGNWTINISVNDTGSPIQLNSTVFYFYVANVQDQVFLDDLSEVTVYTSNNYTFYLNASDNDLLIPDPSVYYESLSFSSNNSNVLISSYLNFSNTTMSILTFNPNSLGIGNHSVNISVLDKSGNIDFTIFNITVLNNTPPSWNVSTAVNFSLIEGNEFYLNLSLNVSDIENDAVSFVYSNSSAFPNFSLSSLGIINFTPTDGDVGRHDLVINVSDGITQTPLAFTFIVLNLNESPRILRPLDVDYNVTINSTTNNINATEDSAARFTLSLQDEDFKIPVNQRSYYNESLSINVTLQGPNTRLFNFTVSLSPGGNPSYPNLTIYSASFTPNKTDVGNYNLTINVSDLSGLSDTLSVNLTIQDINHAPTISSILNQTSLVNATLFIDLNATDIEDGSDNGNLTYSISFLNGTDFINANTSILNITSGILNITFNDSQSFAYTLNLTVNDSTGKQSSRIFYLKVYDFPVFLSPSLNDMLNLTEKVNSNLSFVVNHTVGDNLNFSFYLNNSLRYNVTGFANGSIVNWSFTPNYTDETFGNNISFKVVVTNLIYPQLNTTLNLTMNISHKNAPISFSGSIPNQQKTYDQLATVNLSNYFSDIDSSDLSLNQSLNFTFRGNLSGNSSITVSFSNGSIANTSLLLTFSSGSESIEDFNITATDSEFFNYSNQFTIHFTTPTEGTTTTTISRGGGGGSSQTKPVSLNIIVPGPLTARKQDRLIVPVSLVNTGKVELKGVVLRNTIAKNGIFRDDLLASFDKSYFDKLSPGESQNLTLIVDINTRELGLYEVTLNGTSVSPSFSDTSKLYVNVDEGDTVSEKISFTQEFIAQNPQCIEIKEIIDEARQLYIAGDTAAATEKADQALESCKNAISQTPQSQVREKIYQTIIDNIGVSTLVAVAIGVAYYWFRRLKLQRKYESASNESIKIDENSQIS